MTPHEKQKNLFNYIETAIVGIGICLMVGTLVILGLIDLIKIVIK